MNKRELNRKRKGELIEMYLELQGRQRPEPVTCPSCGSDDITYDDAFVSGSITVSCDECGSRWHEVWRFEDIEMIDGEDNRVARLK